MRIGIDVGGTHTDAVLIEGGRLVYAHKTPTTADVAGGIVQALERLLEDIGPRRTSIEAVMLGTTQFTNAVIERRGLAGVAAIRIGLPTGAELPPMVGWPADAADAVGHAVYMLPGGRFHDGQEAQVPSDREIDAVIRDIEAKRLSTVAISSVFSPVSPQPELLVADRLRAAVRDIRVTVSHEIGRLGLLERENAAILNASLLVLAQEVIDSFEGAMAQHGLDCPFFISQNDGTLMRAAFARRFPVLTVAAGATNSIRGAAWLTGLKEAIVVDIGGTTTDIGVLRGGLPRESNRPITTGGIRTNFRMPDLLVLGLGGGSLVRDDGRRIGPQSVGYRLQQEAMTFGGDTLTATDIAVASGDAVLGAPARLRSLSRAVVDKAMMSMGDMLSEGVTRMAAAKPALPVVFVGGGAILGARGVSARHTIRPRHGDVANAIGAASATIGGEVERIVSLSNSDQGVRSKLAKLATRRAVAAGADPSTVRVVDIEEVPLGYTDEELSRVKVKVVGEIAGIPAG